MDVFKEADLRFRQKFHEKVEIAVCMEIGPQGRAEESKFAHAVAAAYLSDLRQFVVEPVLVVHGFLSP